MTAIVIASIHMVRNVVLVVVRVMSIVVVMVAAIAII